MLPRRSHAWLVLFFTLTLGACWLLTLPLSAAPPARSPSSSEIVISQIYGGGGNTGATWQNDFIELLNHGVASINLAGWSIQYAGAGSSKWSVTTLGGTLSEGSYYLVQEAKGKSGSATLPAPDAVGVIAMSAVNGKVAIVRNLTPISTGTVCPAGPSIVDLVGYGSADCFESAPAPALDNTHAAVRLAAGCTDTNDNSRDFTIGTPNPRNSSWPANPCGIINPPTETATPTSSPSPSPTGESTSTPTATPTFTGTPTATHTPAANGLYVNEFLPHPVTDWNMDGVANVEDEWIEM